LHPAQRVRSLRASGEVMLQLSTEDARAQARNPSRFELSQVMDRLRMRPLGAKPLLSHARALLATNTRIHRTLTDALQKSKIALCPQIIASCNFQRGKRLRSGGLVRSPHTTPLQHRQECPWRARSAENHGCGYVSVPWDDFVTRSWSARARTVCSCFGLVISPETIHSSAFPSEP
jgi:hypothetical protein